MKEKIYYIEIRWSEWMEPMRKDAKCTFGILKGRFRIIKVGIRGHGVNETDDIWKTCCALHNILLDKDGLSQEYDGELDEFDFDDQSEKIPFAIQRLNSNVERRRYDLSRNELDIEHHDVSEIKTLLTTDVSCDSMNYVHKLPMDLFKNKLIEHFSIFLLNKIR